jgi:cobyrinic acid a,c-diamide synthase
MFTFPFCMLVRGLRGCVSTSLVFTRECFVADVRKVGLLIAGTASGVGKTTVALAVMAAFRRRGLVVQPFKGGPDFLDTGHHTRVAGRMARNLDTWMLSHESNVQVLREAAVGADVLLVEGMMGLFDGKSGATEEGSSAEIAKLLKLPVVLVIDAGKSARSVAAVVLGFESFDPDLPLAGIVLNRVAGERHFKMLEAAIVARCRTPILGWLPKEPGVAIPERHLGLRTAEESSDEDGLRLAELAEGGLDLDRMLGLRCGLDLGVGVRAAAPSSLRIGVARDRAFTFYYEDNFDLLRQLGAEIVFFSPLTDAVLPEGLDALYLGGGYPELHALALSGNSSMMRSIREFVDSDRPVYAECGGMMYLGTSLTTGDGAVHAMVGVYPFEVEMTSRLVRFGYVTVEFTRDCMLGPKGTVVRGHSFHYSAISDTSGVEGCYRVRYSLSGKEEFEGFLAERGNVLASYVHLHFRANPAVARHFVAAAREMRVTV